jgi:hypothetical protein
MKNASQIRTHFDSKILGFFLTLFLISLVVFAVRKKNNANCANSKFKISGTRHIVGEPITFEDDSETASSWEWDFGDNSKKLETSKVLHAYDKEGIYTVKLKTGFNCYIEKKIEVYAYGSDIDSSKIPPIEAPSEGTQGQVLTFKDKSNFAEKWEWRFGESDGMSVDASSKTASYAFKNPGNKIVTLVVNGDVKHISRHEIFIRPLVKTDDRISEGIGNRVIGKPRGPKEKGIDEDIFRKLLTGVSHNKLTYTNFAKFFCKDAMPSVHLKDGEVITLKELDERVRNESIKIREVKLQIDKDGCTTKIFLNYRNKWI